MFHSNLRDLARDLTSWANLITGALAATIPVAPPTWVPVLTGAIAVSTFLGIILRGPVPTTPPEVTND